MAKVKKVSAAVVRFWCPGCVTYHSFGMASSGFDGNYERPTFSKPLTVSERGAMKCAMIIQGGMIVYNPNSRHKLAGQNVEMQEPRL